MQRKRLFPIPQGLIACLALSFFSGFSLHSVAQESIGEDHSYKNFLLLSQVMQAIREHYVDKDKTTYRQMTYAALRGMLSELDPHSQFMNPDTYRDMREETEGQFAGIGITVQKSESFVTVMSVIVDTPGQKAGLISGDRIIRIDGKSTENLTQDDVIKRLRGEKGSAVAVTIMRMREKDAPEIRELAVVRDMIKVPSIREALLLPVESTGGIKMGYIRVTQFNEPTPKEFERALEKLQAQGMEALVMDLRDNPGGLLEAAADVAGYFIEPGQLIVSTEGRQNRSVIRSLPGKKFQGFPIAVLINTGSASGAEIVAGALKDLKKAVLVGETTFGKGSVQSVLQLPDASAIRLTTAKYYTPSHQVIHEKGVEPSIRVPLTFEEEEKIQRSRSGRRMGEPGVEPTELVRDIQLDRAVDALQSIQIYASRKAIKPAAPSSQSARK